MKMHELDGHFGSIVEIGWDAGRESFDLRVTDPITGGISRPWENEPPVRSVLDAVDRLQIYAHIPAREELGAALLADKIVPALDRPSAPLHVQLPEPAKPDHGQGADTRSEPSKERGGSNPYDFGTRDVPSHEIGPERELVQDIDR